MIINGKPYNLVLDFPFEKGILISLSIRDDNGKEIQRFEKPIDKFTFKQYKSYIPAVKLFLGMIMR